MDTENTSDEDVSENSTVNKDLNHTGDIGMACIVCGVPLSVRLTQGRKSGKTHIMFLCPISGMHFRGFVSDRNYISEVFKQLEDGS